MNPELRAAQPNRHADRGSTFVEIVVAVALLAVLIVPVMGAVIMTIRASTTATAASEVESALLNAVDRVNRAPVDRCDYSTYAEAALLTQDWSISNLVVTHAYIDTTLPTPNFVQGPTVGSQACPITGYRTNLVQRVSITVSDPGGKVTRTIQVVKSNV